METNSKKSNGVKKQKSIAIATVIASFVVFAATYFAVAENKNSNSVFLDSDQDGLADQEEKTIGTNPQKIDTDGDGYSDGKEVSSGYNPLKAAPGDRLLAAAPTTQKKFEEIEDAGSSVDVLADESESEAGDDFLEEFDESNLTEGMVGEFVKLTLDENGESEISLEDLSYSPEDIDQIVQNALSGADVSKELPEVSDSEIKILPPVEDSPRSGSSGAGGNLDPEEVKARQKQEIEKYLSSLAFIFASHAPFPVEDPASLAPSLEAESDNLFSAIVSGDEKKINFYAQKGESGIEQVKKLETPFVMKDIHKSALQLALYFLSFRDSVSASSSDPMKSLAALSSLQTTSESVLNLQSQLQSILNEYEIKGVEIKP